MSSPDRSTSDSEAGSSEGDVVDEKGFSSIPEKNSIIRLRNESFEVMETLEKEYRQDLAVHLYSTFLAHTKNQDQPAYKWSKWPNRFDAVDDPGNSETYVDEENLMTMELPQTGRETNEQRNGGDDSDEGNEDSDYEDFSDPLENIKIEINAYFSRKISDRIHELNKIRKSKVQPIIDPPIRLPPEYEQKVLAKVDELADIIIDFMTGPFSQRLVSWREVMLRSPNLNSYERCHELFVNFKYRFELRPEEGISGAPQAVDTESAESEKYRRDVSRFESYAKFEENLLAQMAALQKENKRIADDTKMDPMDEYFQHDLRSLRKRRAPI